MTAMLSILFGSKDPWGQRQAFKAHYQAPASGEKLERLNGTESTDLSAE
jgi:hypothetical protein